MKCGAFHIKKKHTNTNNGPNCEIKKKWRSLCKYVSVNKNSFKLLKINFQFKCTYVICLTKLCALYHKCTRNIILLNPFWNYNKKNLINK